MFIPMQVRAAVDVPRRSGERFIDTHTHSDGLGDRLGNFCVALASTVDAINEQAGDCVLDQVEVNVELTSKNEVRLVACSGSDVSGAIKLTFRARRPSGVDWTIDGEGNLAREARGRPGHGREPAVLACG